MSMNACVAFVGGRHPNGLQYGPAKAQPRQCTCGTFDSGL